MNGQKWVLFSKETYLGRMNRKTCYSSGIKGTTSSTYMGYQWVPENHVGIKPSHSIPSSFHHAMATFWWRSVGRVCYRSPAGCRRRDSPRSRAALVKSWAIQNTQSHQLCVGLQPINVYKIYTCPFPIGWLINRGFSYTIWHYITISR